MVGPGDTVGHGCWAPTTRRRCSSGWPIRAERLSAARRRRGDHPRAAADRRRPRPPVRHRGRGDPGQRPARGRRLRVRRASAIADGSLPAQIQETAEITHHPGRAGDLRAAVAGEPWSAGPAAPSGQPRCYFDRMDRRLPIGTGRDGEPLYLNADFLDGTRGAHVSISGISGVATKTSFATCSCSTRCSARACSAVRRDRQHQGADLQRQGRGPAVPGPPQHPTRRADTPFLVRPIGAGRRPVPRRVDLRPAPGRRPHGYARRGQPVDRRRLRSTGRSRSSAPTGCCRTCSPTPTTSASSTRWSSIR